MVLSLTSHKMRTPIANQFKPNHPLSKYRQLSIISPAAIIHYPWLTDISLMVSRYFPRLTDMSLDTTRDDAVTDKGFVHAQGHLEKV